MSTLNLLLFILFLLAIGLGWFMGRRFKRSVKPSKETLPMAYFSGLDYLIDNRTEEAIESFINALEVNSDNLPAHLALAKLLRRKGDIDKAVSIHQTLLKRKDLSDYDRARVKLALSRDFLALGLLDRAEESALPLSLQSDHKKIRYHALELLIRLYEQEGEWSRALQ